MKPNEIRELDSERGNKFYDPEDTWPADDHPKEKKPWLTKTPVNKADMSATNILKSFLSKSKCCDGSHPVDITKPSQGPKDSSEDNTDDLQDLSHLLDSEHMGPKDDSPSKRMKCMSSDLKSKKDKESTRFPEDGEDLAKDFDDFGKALSSRSMYVPRPTPAQYDILRSATTPNTRGHSSLSGPNGVAPLVGATLADAEDSAKVRSKHETYKSCGFHQLVHRVSSGCTMCNQSVSKSAACKGCGEEMYKYKGGSLACQACG